MKSGAITSKLILVGAIAGFISGLAAFVSNVIGANLGIWETLPGQLTIEFMLTQLPGQLSYNTIWGIIFGVFYAFFYDYIPGKGVKKGLVYGLIVWIIAILCIAAISLVYGYYQWGIPYLITGFFSITITYGLLIGYLYKKE